MPALILAATKPPFPHKKHNPQLCYVFLNAPYTPNLPGFILSTMRVTNVTSITYGTTHKILLEPKRLDAFYPCTVNAQCRTMQKSI